MIAKQVKGTDFSKCIRYLLNKQGSMIIGGNMSGCNEAELTTEFELSQRVNLNRRSRKNVYHVSLSVPIEEKFDETKWRAIAQDYLNEMGFNNNQFLIVLHRDTEHNHIHLVTCRLKLDGEVVSDSWDWPRSQRIIRQLEQKYQLTKTTTKNPLRKSPTTGEKRLNKRTGNLSIRQQLQTTIDQACQTQQTLPDLVKKLHLEGINIQFNFNNKGQPRGISYQLDGITFSGTQLGKAYSFSGLQKYQNVDYNSARDDQELLLLNNLQVTKINNTKSDKSQEKEQHNLEINSHQIQQIATTINQLLERSNSQEFRGNTYTAIKEERELIILKNSSESAIFKAVYDQEKQTWLPLITPQLTSNDLEQFRKLQEAILQETREKELSQNKRKNTTEKVELNL